MICPHCSTNLLRKERGGRRCSKCRREFALEPKESPFGLHDIRIRKLAEKFGDGRGLRYTLVQLWYAAGRKKVPDVRRVFNGVRIAVWIAIGVLTVALVVSSAMGPVAAIIVAVVVLVLADAGLRAAKPWFLSRTTVRMPVPYNTFRRDVVGRWSPIHGGPPSGSVDEAMVKPPIVERPRIAVLCPDRSVLACLTANNVPQTGAIALADRIDRLPPHIPVIVLHDASLPGIELAGRARAALGPRAVVVGLSPRAVLANASVLRLREPRPTEQDAAFLRREPLSETEIEWLADGWWSPIAAIAPAKLLAVVERAVERVEDAGDPDRRRAREVGFLTWPTG
ncbi:hypothetical protein OG874_32650 [Nocardia sp. NBC_00565]|uniref:hypothetical protein n=1 Tax=Nocardia sp. NBC_00565 TaxID=2975993 RepID=UPI002E81639D|nr:hypothetical protein [Nocardia sp. NBC_00565]WUC01515.1 hypothetical protein OG874_32650 [Nocardia sp. NBC_00565]